MTTKKRATPPVAPTAPPSLLRVYFKAVVAFIATLLGTVGTWMTSSLDGGVSGAEWGGLVFALGTTLGATAGVAWATNAQTNGAGETERGDTGLGFLLWLIAVVLVVAGVVQLFQGQLLLGIVLIVVGLAIGPGGYSIFRSRPGPP